MKVTKVNSAEPAIDPYPTEGTLNTREVVNGSINHDSKSSTKVKRQLENTYKQANLIDLRPGTAP